MISGVANPFPHSSVTDAQREGIGVVGPFAVWASSEEIRCGPPASMVPPPRRFVGQLTYPAFQLVGATMSTVGAKWQHAFHRDGAGQPLVHVVRACRVP